MKRFGIILMLMFCTLSCLYAQNDNWKKHVGALSPEQIQKIQASFVKGLPYILNTRKLSEKESLQAYMSFRKIKNYAPYAFYDLYSNNFIDVRSNYNNQSVYGNILDSISDKAMRAMFVKDLLAFEHNLVDHLDSVNLIRLEIAHIKDPISEPVALIKYAHIYYLYASNPLYYPSNLYDKVQARENYASAFRLMREKNIDPGDEIEAFYVSEYYDVCEDLYQSDKEKYFEQFLDDYLQITQTCDKLLIPFYEVPDSIKNVSSEPKYQKFRDYNNIAKNIQINETTGDTIKPINERFRLSGAAKVENLDKYYSARLDDHKSDTAFLERAVHLMTESGAMGSPIHIDYCSASYNLKHNFENSLGMGMTADDIQKKREYYLEALKYADTPDKKLLVFYLIAESTFSNPQKLLGKTRDSKTLKLNCDSLYDQWEAEMEICNGTLSNIIALSAEAYKSPSLTIRDYPARACYMLGYNLRWKGMVDSNVSMLKDARAYIEKSQELGLVAKNIGAIGVAAPSVLSYIDKQITAAEARAKKYKADKAAQAAYEAYLKKKKAEEDFWNQ